MTSANPDPQPSTDFAHIPVMLDEVVAVFKTVPEGYFLDATLGGAGHSSAMLQNYEGLSLIGIDQDPVAIEVATERLSGFTDRCILCHGRFDQLRELVQEAGISSLVGFLFDLGVSSPQLDVAERGFSFRHDGPLDMRMDPTSGLSAAVVVNEYSERDLARLLRSLGDERHSQRIAAAVVTARPIQTTTQLAEIVVNAIPAAARRVGGHPAKRSFQALRIEVNNELDILGPTLEAALDLLVPGGRGAVLTYHSGEDRIVKDIFRSRTTSIDPPGLPVPQHKPDFELLRPVARQPTNQEVEGNRRARSARLRTIERVAA